MPNEPNSLSGLPTVGGPRVDPPEVDIDEFSFYPEDDIDPLEEEATYIPIDIEDTI
jgi:hypothetical protein